MKAEPRIHTIKLKTARPPRHPWIFSKMVEHPRRRPDPGSLVEVWAADNRFVGRGLYHPFRTVAVRILSYDQREALDAELVRRRLEAAKRLREEVLRIPEAADSYRLVHGEADGFPGLVVDKLADALVVEPFSAGYLTIGPWLAEALSELYPGCRVVFRPDKKTEEGEGVSFEALASRYPAPASVEIREHALRMKVDFESGHKTGFFLDQRDNRAEVARLARGAEVFDLYCYTGGFSIAALFGGALKSTAVDLDEKAIETARANARRNGLADKLELVHRDCFDFLREAARENRQADLVVVDPAKLAAVREEIPRALKTYHDINALAVRAVKPGGILLSCSCSGLVDEPRFLAVLANAAAEAGSVLQIFKVAGAAPDHPVRSDFPEGRYLKAVFARVLR